MLRRFFLLLLVSFVPAVSLAQRPAQALSTVPASRLANLRRGINASQWFAQVWDPKGYTKEHFQSWNTPADFALIKSMGFNYVRLSINPQPLMDAERANQGAEYFGYIDAAVKMILDAGLAAQLDMHPDSDFKQKLSQDDFVERFAGFWREFAQHYSTWDPDRVFFEILNEPEMWDAYRWYGVEAKLAAAIRQGAPEHTIIATGARWDDDDDVIFLEPLRDPNVIYVFHFYEPHIFTHQGANWGAYFWRYVKGLRYPSSPQNTLEVAANVPDPVRRLSVIRYGEDHWNAARIQSEIDQAVDWARAHKVPLICNEFGVYREFADPRDRAEWIKDARKALEQDNIGWAMWDYSGSFGLVTKKDGRAAPDEDTLKALGLSLPSNR